LVVGSQAGDASDGLQPLRDAVVEAESVGRHFADSLVLTGTRVRKSTIESELPRATVFHFSGHAGQHLGQMSLLVGSNDPRNGSDWFSTDDVDSSHLSQLELAVLSGCATENGENAFPAEVDSLASAFLRAGTLHVIATKWNVDSETSLALMEGFYSELVSGQPSPRALASAVARIRSRPATSHPYFWAGYEEFGVN